MKKVLALMLLLIMVVSSVACSNEEPKPGALKIYMLNDNPMIRAVIEDYQAKIPESIINIEIGVPDYDTTVSDALKKLNTRLLGGDGPDIMIMDDINVESYVEANRLYDLSEIVEGEKNLSKSVVKNSTFGDTVYTLPICATLMVDIKKHGSAVDFTSLDQFIKTIKSENLAVKNFENLAALWYRSKIEPMISEHRKVKKTELKAFYEDLNELMYMIYGDDEQSRFASFQQINMQVNRLMGMEYVYYNEIGATKDYVDKLSILQGLYSMAEEEKIDSDFVLWQGEPMYIPMGNMAVNSGSHNKEASLALIKYLVSEEGQKQAVKTADIIPINLNALKTVMEESGEIQQVTGNLGTYYAKPFSESSIAELSTLINDMSYNASADGILMELVMIGAQGFLNGDETLDSTLTKTLKKVGIYLEE